MSEYLKIPEVARRLDVSEKTARRYIRSGELPSAFIGGAYRVSEEDLAGYQKGAIVKPEELTARPKAQAPLPLENGAVEDRGLRYLKAWRFFVWRLEDRWQKEPPASRGEVAVVLDVMKSLIDEGAFDHPLGDEAGVGSDADRHEQFERSLLFMCIKKLNEIADDIEAGEEAGRRRATFREIKTRMALTA